MLKNVTQLWKNFTQFIDFREQFAKAVNQLHKVKPFFFDYIITSFCSSQSG